MIGLILALGQLKPTLIFSSDSLLSTVAATVLTEDDIVAGFFCEALGPHADARKSRPFVWENGKLAWLSTGEFRFGRIFGGRGRVLVGELSNGDTPVPAKWTADPNLGWSASQALQLSSEPAYAVAVSSKGDVLIQKASVLSKISGSSQVTDYPCPAGRFVGLDGQDRVWWNKPEDQAPPSKSVVFYERGKVNSPAYRIVASAVNSRGDVCGTPTSDSGNEFGSGGVAIVRQGKIQWIQLPPNKFSAVTDLNDRGEVIGYFNNYGLEQGVLNLETGVARLADGTVMRTEGFLLTGGRVSILRIADMDRQDFEPMLINNRGTIVGGSDQRIYLVRTR